MLGTRLLITIENQSKIEKTPSELESLHLPFLQRKQEKSESLTKHTSKVLSCANALRGTKFRQNDEEISQRWRIGLGSKFKIINDSIDILGHTPKRWNLSNLFCLMEAATSIQNNFAPKQETNPIQEKNKFSETLLKSVESPKVQNKYEDQSLLHKIHNSLQKQDLRQSSIQKEATALIDSGRMTKELESSPKFAQKFLAIVTFVEKTTMSAFIAIS